MRRTGPTYFYQLPCKSFQLPACVPRRNQLSVSLLFLIFPVAVPFSGVSGRGSGRDRAG